MNSDVARRPGTVQGLGLIAVAMMPTLAIVSLVPNLPQLLERFASVPNHELLVPMIITLPSLCIALFSPIAGAIADFWGRKRLLIVALFAYSILGLLPLLLSDLPGILASRFVVGVAEAAILTAGNALMGDYFAGEQRKKWLGIQATLGPFVASMLILAGGKLGSIHWRAPFVLYALGLLVLIWVVFGMWEPKRQIAEPSATPAERARFPWSATAMVGAVTVAISVVYFVQAVQLGRIFAELGAGSPQRISVIVTIASIGVVLGGAFYRKLARRPISQVFGIIFLCIGVGYLGLALSPDYRAGLPLGVIAQFANGLTIPAMLTWALSKYEFEHRGRGIGIWGSCFFTGTFLSPPALTLISSLTGSFLTAVGCVGGLCLLVALILWLLPTKLVAAPTAVATKP